MVFFAFQTITLDNNEKPKPLKVYTKDGVSIPSYDFKGLRYFLNQKNDTTYVVNFWATWCLPCVEELPYFEALQTKYKNQKVKVILVSLDMSKQIESRLIPFLIKKKIQSQVLVLNDVDANAWIEQVDQSWSGAIPATAIYNKNKSKFHERSFNLETLEAEIFTFK